MVLSDTETLLGSKIEANVPQLKLGVLWAKRIEDLLRAMRDRILDLRQDKCFKYILLFKNHGEQAGASLEHAHSQLIALPILPKHVIEELGGAKQYYYSAASSATSSARNCRMAYEW